MTTPGRFCRLVLPSQAEKKQGQEAAGFRGTPIVWPVILARVLATGFVAPSLGRHVLLCPCDSASSPLAVFRGLEGDVCPLLHILPLRLSALSHCPEPSGSSVPSARRGAGQALRHLPPRQPLPILPLLWPLPHQPLYAELLPPVILSPSRVACSPWLQKPLAYTRIPLSLSHQPPHPFCLWPRPCTRSCGR